jgi:hypothetical protein
MGNPALFPFFTETECTDILLVQVNPVRRADVPKTAQAIMERVSEITFNASLLREFRAIDFVNRLLEENRLDPKRYKRNRLHRIDATEALARYTASSKLDTSWRFFEELHEAGMAAASDWLAEHYADIGVRSTLDLRAEFMCRVRCDGDASCFPPSAQLRRRFSRSPGCVPLASNRLEPDGATFGKRHHQSKIASDSPNIVPEGGQFHVGTVLQTGDVDLSTTKPPRHLLLRDLLCLSEIAERVFLRDQFFGARPDSRAFRGGHAGKDFVRGNRAIVLAHFLLLPRFTFARWTSKRSSALRMSDL